MRLVVVGAGEVGSYIAERLSRLDHDVAVVDSDLVRLEEVAVRLDVLTVPGSGTNPRVLEEAGIRRADMVVAVTNNDEVNLVASLLAKQAGVARSVVRIEAPELRARSAAELHRAVGADLVIDPDDETAHQIQNLLELPGAREVALMASGEVIVVGARLGTDSPVVGRSLSDLARELEPEWEFLFGVIRRGGEAFIPRGDDILAAHDVLRVVCKPEARARLAALLGIRRTALRRVLLLGGGRTAEVLADALRSRTKVTIVERDPERARQLAERLEGVLVLQGEITDTDVLDEADITHVDAVIALTGRDDTNVLACLYARRAGASETIAVVHRLALLPLLDEAGVDVALSPRSVSADAVLRFVRGDVSQVTTSLEDDVEVVEFTVQPSSPADGARVADLHLPKDVLIGAVVRDGKAAIARGRSTLRENDHVVVFALPHAVQSASQAFG